MLLLLFYQFFVPVESSEVTNKAAFFKPVTACPDVGYFFERRNTTVQAPACYLCLCKGLDHAICLWRPNERCDAQHYDHEERSPRVRRSLGLGDVFFRDAARQIFNKEPANNEECKPFQSSKSIGCPPADWCTGCLVCDCDANGHWDCHLMSFCDGKKPGPKDKKYFKSPVKKNKDNKKSPSKKPVKAMTTKKPTAVKKIAEKNVKYQTKDKIGKKLVRKSVTNPEHNVTEPTKISVETKKRFLAKRKLNTPDSPLIIKRYISTSSPIKSPELLKFKNDSQKLAQMLYKKYVANAKKSIKQSNDPSKKENQKVMGDKIINNPSAFKNKMKQIKPNSKRSKNSKEHKDKLKLLNLLNKRKIRHNKRHLKKKSDYEEKKYKGKKYKDNKKRNKREITLNTTEAFENMTTTESIPTEYTVIPKTKISEVTEIIFTKHEETSFNLSHYAYVVDNNDTNNYGSSGAFTTSPTTKKNAFIDDTISTTELVANVETVKRSTDNRTATEHCVQGLYITENGTKTKDLANTTAAKLSEKRLNNTTMDFKVAINNKTNDTCVNKSKNLDRNVKRKMSIKKVLTEKKRLPLKKLITILKSKPKVSKSQNSKTQLKVNGSVSDIQTVIEKLLQGFTRTDHENKQKHRSFTAIKYLKKLFTKIFLGNKNKSSVNKIAVVDSICENFGPCQNFVKKLPILNLKVKELISETQKALKSIKIIKGLLQLIDNGKDARNNTTSKEFQFRAHVKKLNDILRDNYIPEKQLTPTQMNQIKYVKSNAQVFIKSIGKFASTLNNIINIIKIHNAKRKQEHMASEKHAISKLKSMLLRYNLFQNTFIRKMYEGISSLELKINNHDAKTCNLNHEKHTNDNNKMALKKYMDNILYNLKKLNELASKISFQERRKREITQDDDAIEYLLTLMEYLLKNNYPLDTPPVNDGIDLLIEAIRNAPDIKPIKKKVLQYVPVKIAETKSSESKEEDVSSSQKMSNKDDLNEDTKKLEDIDKEKVEDDTVSNDIVDEDRRKSKDSYKPIYTTTKVDVNAPDLSDVITEYPSKVYMATFTTEESSGNTFFEKTDSSIVLTTESDRSRKKEDDSDTVILDEENSTPLQQTSSDIPDSKTEPTTLASVTRTRSEKTRHYIPVNNNKIKNKKEGKTKLDLINEAYEQEIEERKFKLTTEKPVQARYKGETGKRNRAKSNDISSFTKEAVDQEKLEKDEESVIYKKQMDLLSSLDYGTERSMVEDSDSKDNSPLDRLNVDAFPNYFA